MESELACILDVIAIPRNATTARLGVRYNCILLEAPEKASVGIFDEAPVSHDALRKFHVRPFTIIENHCS